MSVKITDNTPKIKIDTQRSLSLALRYAVDEVDKRAMPKTPKNRGELRKNLLKSVVGNKGIIQWKSGYAWYQERGYTTGPIKRYTTPGTGAHFAENAVKSMDRDRNSIMRKARLI